MHAHKRPKPSYGADTKEKTSFPLNPEQAIAAKAPFAPLLIVAGAGTGKTRTLTSRIAYLIESGIPPWKICAITFTNKAAKEMADRTRLAMSSPKRLTSGSAKGPFIGTFHSLGARILREECRALERKPNFTIFDDHDSFNLIKKAAKSVLPKNDSDKEGIKKDKETPAFFAQGISKIKNISGSDLTTEPPNEKSMATRKVFQKYESALIENNAFDFDDLIEKAVAIMRSHPAILKKYQNRFDAVLVDEYQDINPKQYEFIQLLAGRHHNVSVVGDDEQTIYSWRYADIGIFLNFEKHWPGAQIFFLEENYRSTGNIIRAASSVVKNNLIRTPKTLWTKNAPGAPIRIFESWGENEEAEWIAREIKKMKNGSIAVLYRTNAQSRAIEQALIRCGIPYQIFGGLKFYERREVRDAVAALRYASNHHDAPSRERLEKNLSKKKFAEFKDALAKAGGIPPQEIIALFLETFHYFDYLEENFINADERGGNIAELITFASEFESLSELLEKVSLLQAIDDENNKDGEKKETWDMPVCCMTIHLAKGLEFDSVFIAGASEGCLPHGRSLANERSLEEERRLMYVAMTRARKNLAISFYGTPSRFLEEIPEECVALQNNAGGGTSPVDDEKDDDYEEVNYIDLD
jgi:DNA helicase-2/ATP-dependent DNA helicase PcrA